MSKDEISRKLQEMGYRGRYIYISKSHPDAEVRDTTKAAGIISDVGSGMKKRDVARKYSTCLPYINRVLLVAKNGAKTKKRKAILPLELWKSVVSVYKGLGRTGGYVYVPVALKGDKRASESGLNGQKTTLLYQEFSSGNYNARELAERFETTVGYIYKLKSIWLKKRGN
ncbi:MAG: hypothetical protein ACYC69_02675 [Thermodesulfovibrionales bacterium]